MNENEEGFGDTVGKAENVSGDMAEDAVKSRRLEDELVAHDNEVLAFCLDNQL